MLEQMIAYACAYAPPAPRVTMVDIEANIISEHYFTGEQGALMGLPVFEGSKSAYPVEARLKFRQANDKLTFWFELVRADRVFRRAVVDELFSIKEKTGFKLLTGTPGLTA